jgi:uncharacterized protein (TIRG00374 family)
MPPPAALPPAPDVRPAPADAPAPIPEGATRAALSPRQVAFPIGLSLLAIGVAIWLTYEPGAFALMWSRLRPGLLLLAVAALAAQTAIAAYRLHYASRGRVPYAKAVRAQLTWDFLSGITPSAVGGGPLAGVFIARENRLSVGEATALMMYLMVADQAWFCVLIPALLFAATLLPVFPAGAIGAGTITLYLLGLMTWAGFFAYATLVRPEVFERVARWLLRLRPLRRYEARVTEELVKLRRQSRVLRGRSPFFFVGAVALSAAVWTCRYLVLLFVAWSVAPGLDALTFLLRAAALWLTSMILPTPGGAGGMEGLFVLFFGAFLPDGFAGPTLLTWRLLAYYLVVGLGFGIASSTLGEMLLARRHARAARRAAR